MMRKENELLTIKAFGTSSEDSVAESKKAYEKPTLDIVKFMFESDITFGSFEEGKGDDNYYDDDNWWAD